MKIGIIGDIHWCQYSSIIRKRGNKYSLRLENCINSINWAEALTSQLKCDVNVYMGDFFDKPDLNSEELSALREIKWNDLDKYFIVGNHEMGSSNLDINSSNVFELLDSYLDATETIKPFHVVDKPYVFGADLNTHVLLLPYILENKREALSAYFNFEGKKNILFMHNDISGIQLGNFLSTQGFSIEEIESNVDLCINGHIHNGGKISEKIINVGNLTGQNFSENAHQHQHVIFIVDTETLKVFVYENPFAFNFYKEDWVEGIPFQNYFKDNAVVTVQTSEDNYNHVKHCIYNNPHIVESRILIKPDSNKSVDVNYEDLSIDHYKAFEEFVLSKIGSSDIVKEEVNVILQ